MSEHVRVEVSSAVVSYRPAVGEERSLALESVVVPALFKAAPWRTFRWYYGQKHYPGAYWAATISDHVIYESRLELETLLLADFDPAVRRIVAQPFLLRADVDGQVRRHVPDYLLETNDGPVVVDVVRRARLEDPRIARLCSWTGQLARSQAWSYRVASETDPTMLANVRFLAGYRRERFVNQGVVSEMRSEKANLLGRALAEAERSFGKHPQPLVRAGILHLLWRQELIADLSRPLRPSTVLRAPR